MCCHYCDKNNHITADCRAIANCTQQKKACFESNAAPEKKSFALCFLFGEIDGLKRQLQLKPEKTTSSKKRKAESHLSTKFSLTTSSDEGDYQEYFFTFSKPFSSSKIKLAILSHPTTNQ
jgi:hypothetical protein